MNINTLSPPDLMFTTRLTSFNDEQEHTHTYFELFYIQEGTIIHHASSEQTVLKIGDGFLIAPDVPHKFQRLRDDCVHRDYLISSSLMQLVCNYIDPALYLDICQMRFIPFKIDFNDILSFERSITFFLSENDVPKRKKLERILTVTLVGNIYQQANISDVGDNSFYANCLQILNNNFTQPDYMAKIQKECDYNNIYLCRKFKSTFGKTITEYVKDMRLNYAAYLLQETDYTISKVCSLIGIESLSYFIKVFKETFEKTPSTYRNKSALTPNL